MLGSTLKGTSKRKLEVMSDLIDDFGRVRFGLLERKRQQLEKTPSRWQNEMRSLMQELKSLR